MAGSKSEITPLMTKSAEGLAPTSVDKKNDYLATVESDVESDLSTHKPDNPFADPVVAEYYRDVYERAQYECRHVFDPEVEWTEEEEKAIVRKLDWRVSLTSCILFISLQVDRGNLSQAAADNFLDVRQKLQLCLLTPGPWAQHQRL